MLRNHDLIRFPEHSNMHTNKVKNTFSFSQFCSHRGKIDTQSINWNLQNLLSIYVSLVIVYVYEIQFFLYVY